MQQAFAKTFCPRCGERLAAVVFVQGSTFSQSLKFPTIVELRQLEFGILLQVEFYDELAPKS